MKVRKTCTTGEYICPNCYFDLGPSKDRHETRLEIEENGGCIPIGYENGRKIKAISRENNNVPEHCPCCKEKLEWDI